MKPDQENQISAPHVHSVPQHFTGAQPPKIPANNIPQHVALVMDGNGRWAKQRNLPRTEGHKHGEAVLMDMVYGAIEIGIKYLTVYAFSTENWLRSPKEVRFLMGFNREVLRRQRDNLDKIGVKILWSGSKGRLWKSVIAELEIAQAQTKFNDKLILNICINYGGQLEIVDAVKTITKLAVAGKINPQKITAKTLTQYMYISNLPPVDLFLRPSGEQRISNFLLWHIAYAELVFQTKLFPDCDRLDLWDACVAYAQRNRRFGKA